MNYVFACLAGFGEAFDSTGARAFLLVHVKQQARICVVACAKQSGYVCRA